MVIAGQVDENTPVLASDMTQWIPAYTVSELASLFMRDGTFCIETNGQPSSPYDYMTLTQMIKSGQVTVNTPVLASGTTQWVPAYTVPQFTSLFIKDGTYFIRLNEQPSGPYDYDALRQMVRLGQVNEQTSVLTKDPARWIPAATVSELTSLFLKAGTYFILVNGQSTGPYDYSALRQMVKLGQMNENTSVLTRETSLWLPAVNVPELTTLFKNQYYLLSSAGGIVGPYGYDALQTMARSGQITLNTQAKTDEMFTWSNMGNIDELRPIFIKNQMEIKMPIRAGYWGFTTAEWVGYVQSYVTGSLGLDFYPEFQFPPLFRRRHELSFGIAGEYQYGVGKEPVGGMKPGQLIDLHMITLAAPVKYHFGITSRNWLSLGVGPFCQWQLWQTQEKYEDAVREMQILVGLAASAGYSFHINNRISLDAGVNCNFYFDKVTAPVIQYSLGTTFTLFSKNTRSPWL
jgi:hypothetical protein